jgi:hypothetical protein
MNLTQDEIIMLSCLVYLIVWLIVILIILYIVEMLLSQLLTLPPPVMVLIRLLAGLILLIMVLNCFGLLDGPPFRMLR